MPDGFYNTGRPHLLPDCCPYTLDDLLDRDFDVDALAARLGDDGPGPA